MARKSKGNNSVTIYPDWCKGCGICVEFCPQKVLGLNDQGKATVVREANCIRCGFCELHCPDFAIVVKNKEEPVEVEMENGTPKPKAKAKPKAKGKGA
ncbi:MAG: 4Fe-4S binding protein [Desulfovibrionaceae bacterium]|nr:4Fe-4S binding protein [Desulfovibrionaceae bacterium]